MWGKEGVLKCRFYYYSGMVRPTGQGIRKQLPLKRYFVILIGSQEKGSSHAMVGDTRGSTRVSQEAERIKGNVGKSSLF